MEIRRRFKQELSFFERCHNEAGRLRMEAKMLPPGAKRDELDSKAHQAEAAASMERWLRSPELQPPK